MPRQGSDALQAHAPFVRLQVRLQLLVELPQSISRGRRRRRQPFERQRRRLLRHLGRRLLWLGYGRRPAAVEPGHPPQSAIDGGQAPRRTRRPRVAPRLLHSGRFNGVASSMRGAMAVVGCPMPALEHRALAALASLRRCFKGLFARGCFVGGVGGVMWLLQLATEILACAAPRWLFGRSCSLRTAIREASNTCDRSHRSSTLQERISCIYRND